MTNEEKARAYDEALDRCKEWVSGTWGHSVDDTPKDIAEYIFPQLAESEDEILRQALIYGINKYGDEYKVKTFAGWPITALIAYLEKQKPEGYLDKDMVYAIMNKLHKLTFSQLIPINSDEYKMIDEITSDVRKLLDYPIEQKPSEEDEGESGTI